MKNNQHNLKAFITVLKGEYKAITIPLPLQFNPLSYTVGVTNKYNDGKDKDGKDVPLQFLSAQDDDLSLDLLFDSTDDGTDVRLKLLTLEALSLMDFEEHAPSPCMFVWGSFLYIGIISKLTKKFTYFYQDGTPSRVRVTLVLKPYINAKTIIAKLKQHSSDLTKGRTLKSGDNIWLMAYKEYQDPRFWRDIARKNDIDDPRKIDMGRELELPPRGKDDA